MGFRDLQRYPALKSRYDKYKEWLDATPAERQQKYKTATQGTIRVKVVREKGYISPFGTLGTTKVYVPTRLIATVQTGQGAGTAAILRDLLANYTIATKELEEIENAITIEAKKFKAARLSLTTVGAASSKPSRITGREYNKPIVDSVSCAFGQNTGGQDYEKAVLAIKGEAAFQTFTSGDNAKNRYKFTPEG